MYERSHKKITEINGSYAVNISQLRGWQMSLKKRQEMLAENDVIDFVDIFQPWKTEI